MSQDSDPRESQYWGLDPVMLQELAQAQAAAASLHKQLQQLQEHSAAEALKAAEALHAAQQGTQAAAASGKQGMLICCTFCCAFPWPDIHGWTESACPIIACRCPHGGNYNTTHTP